MLNVDLTHAGFAFTDFSCHWLVVEHMCVYSTHTHIHRVIVSLRGL